MRRGQEAVSAADIVAARLLFERAAALGSAAAATAAGKTYDPDFPRGAGAGEVPADSAEAVRWYRKGAALGDAEAQARLLTLEARSRE